LRTRNEAAGNAFKRIRGKYGLKQSEMAELADCSLRNYQNIESGESQPGYGILQNVIQNIPLDPRELFAAEPVIEENPEVLERISYLLTQCNEVQLQLICTIIEGVIRAWKSDKA
jgi:transcriptional regulator with XRE-family HTH domain